MTKLKKEELLSILTAVFSHYLSTCNYKETATKYEEAHKQIKEMIQKPGVTEAFVKKHAVHMSVNAYYDADDHKQGVTPAFGYPRVENAIRKMLKEAGVHVS